MLKAKYRYDKKKILFKPGPRAVNTVQVWETLLCKTVICFDSIVLIFGFLERKDFLCACIVILSEEMEDGR